MTETIGFVVACPSITLEITSTIPVNSYRVPRAASPAGRVGIARVPDVLSSAAVMTGKRCGLLAHFEFTGLEPQFDDIKRFIFTGKDHGRFIEPLQEPFVEQLKNPNALTKHWCHLLSAQYNYSTVEARMQFFSGPKLKPLVWRVKLGPSPARVVGTFNKGFAYRYFEKADKEGYLGEMTELQRAKP